MLCSIFSFPCAVLSRKDTYSIVGQALSPARVILYFTYWKATAIPPTATTEIAVIAR